MIILHDEIVDWVDPVPRANTHLIAVQVDDINTQASKMITTIEDTSWLQDLDFIDREAIEDTVLVTARILTDLFKTIDNEITSEFGESLVTMSAGETLQSLKKHVILPLSELWCIKKKNNHSFDFHTETPETLIACGEAKYNSSQTALNAAAKQVKRFITEKKDKYDAKDLKLIASTKSAENLVRGQRDFCLAFSLHTTDAKKSLYKTLENIHVVDLMNRCNNLYIVGIIA